MRLAILVALLLAGCASEAPVRRVSYPQAAGETVAWVSIDKANRRFVVTDMKWELSERVSGGGTTFWVVRKTFQVDPALTAPYSPLPRG